MTQNVFKFKLLVFLLCLTQLFSNHSAFAQDDIELIKGKSSLFFQVWGPEIIGVHYNVNLHNNVSINIGLGVNADAHIGSNIYLLNRNKSRYASLYFGGQLISYHLYGGSDRQLGVYIPFGLEIKGINNITVQFEGGPNFVEEDWSQRNTKSAFGCFRIGKTF